MDGPKGPDTAYSLPPGDSDVGLRMHGPIVDRQSTADYNAVGISCTPFTL